MVVAATRRRGAARAARLSMTRAARAYPRKRRRAWHADLGQACHCRHSEENEMHCYVSSGLRHGRSSLSLLLTLATLIPCHDCRVLHSTLVMTIMLLIISTLSRLSCCSQQMRRCSSYAVVHTHCNVSSLLFCMPVMFVVGFIVVRDNN